MSTVLKVIKKQNNYQEHKITIECQDTNYQGLVKKLKALSGINLNDNLNGVYFADSLAANIKYRQDKINESLVSFESYIIGLGYVLDIPSYLTIPSGTVLAGERIDYDLLQSIVNNEKDFYIRMQNIKQIELDNNIKFQKPNTRIINYLLNEIFPIQQIFDFTKLNKYGTMRNHQFILSNMPTNLIFSDNTTYDYNNYNNFTNVNKFNYKNELGNLLKKEVLKYE